MSDENRRAREELERIYGKKCMIHEGIRRIHPPKVKKARYKGKSIASQLTYHHIYPKHLGGKATVENGAVLCRACHDYLEQASPAERARLNAELQAYKKNACKVTFVDDIDLPYEERAMIFETDSLEKPKPKYDRRAKKREDKEIIDEYYEGDEISDLDWEM